MHGTHNSGRIGVSLHRRLVKRIAVFWAVKPCGLLEPTFRRNIWPQPSSSVLSRATQRHIPEDRILHSHRHEDLKSYIALTGWALQRRRNVSPVRYKLGSYIPEDDILQSPP
jgi:hypothetical protein